MSWNRGAQVSKEDHRGSAEHVLRPGEAQHMRAGAGDASGTRGGSGGGGATWRGQERASAGRGSGGADVGVARGTRKGGAGAAGAWYMAGGAARSGASKNKGAEGWR
jgi:hypothetical protein